ncbi:hypothetical protein BGZ63DRAFT_378071 [Mariannaea sp. PMI_226]|nr:hypothetical protein BGZ63DRAFT_378071 [Mariannaea sp. PMI_226]
MQEGRLFILIGARRGGSPSPPSKDEFGGLLARLEADTVLEVNAANDLADIHPYYKARQTYSYG